MNSKTGTLKLVINQSCAVNLKMNTAMDTTSWSNVNGVASRYGVANLKIE
jgi:hypothetical protein